MAALDQNLPSISIVVPSFNQSRYLRDSLESIFRQAYPRLEVCVMDGGSTDESVDIIRSYEDRLTYWQSQPDGGQSAAINAGMRHCSGDIVAWLNSDDYYWGNSLWTVGRAYAALPDRGLYIGNGLRFNQREERYNPFCRSHLALNRTALIQGLDYLLQPATFFLRSAWEHVQGLNPALRFCMDWDIIIRIAATYPAVLINEFLAVSREYEETKTSSGKMSRAIEISGMIQSHTHEETTPGSLFYLLETLLDVTDQTTSSQLRYHLYEGMNAIRGQLAAQYGRNDGFPEQGDPQDDVYLPFATSALPQRYITTDSGSLPSISLITPSFNQAQFLEQTLESIFSQGYPRLETLVFDGGSRDGSLEVLQRFQDRLTYWVSEADNGPAHALNKGFAMAQGEILGWLNSDDLLAADALWEVSRAFAEDPELDMVFANALYINEDNRLYLADHGTYRTGFYYGEIQPLGRIPAYWAYVHSIPQPTVFFRRRLLERCGELNEAYHFIFDFELFWRFAQKAKIKKLEQTLAFYRIHAAAKTSDWNKFLIELYRFSRPWWPRLYSPEFRHTFRDFVGSFMRRRFGNRPHDIWFWGAAAVVGFSALTRVGNPEALSLRLPPARLPRPPAPAQLPPEAQPSMNEATASAEPIAQSSMYAIDARHTRYRSLFCSYTWPRHPGHSGGEIRDFHLLRRLLSISKVEFLVSHPSPPDKREDPLGSYLEVLHTPETIRMRPDLFAPDAFRRTLRSRAVNWLRRANLPVLGPRYHLDVANQFPNIEAYSRAALQKALETKRPDFLFVSPQTNPVALLLDTTKVPTRMIMAAYDVEAVRMYRIAASYQGPRKVALELEARRAAHYERANLAYYDGVIAVSDLDRQIFIRDYGFAPERVLVIENSVDSNYFAFVERQPIEQPQIAFVGSLTYLPNQQAAWRLIRQIMPLVRQHYPHACLWIVGQSPDAALLAESDGNRVVVTGKVDDVRPYLAHASLACVPLISGSGTKYKVLEALSAGVPMVCSPLAIEGLDIEVDKHVLVGQSDAELAAAIVRLLDDPMLAVDLARQGRELVEQRYTWDVNLARLDGWLDQMIALPRRMSTPQSDPLIHPVTDGEAASLEQSDRDTVLTLNVTTTEGGKPHD